MKLADTDTSCRCWKQRRCDSASHTEAYLSVTILTLNWVPSGPGTRKTETPPSRITANEIHNRLISDRITRLTLRDLNSHGGDNENYCVLGCDTVKSGRRFQCFGGQ